MLARAAGDAVGPDLVGVVVVLAGLPDAELAHGAARVHRLSRFAHGDFPQADLLTYQRICIDLRAFLFYKAGKQIFEKRAKGYHRKD